MGGLTLLGAGKYPAIGGGGAVWGGVTAGLTHWWPMDDANVSGSNVSDLVGSSTGTIVGTVTSGESGAARTFAAAGKITLSSGLIPALSGAHSISMRVRPTDITGRKTLLVLKIDASNGILIVQDSAEFGVAIWKPSETSASSRSKTSFFAAGTETTIGYSFDGTTTILYGPSGALSHASADGSWGLGDGSFIGTRDADLNQAASATIQDVLIYNTALSAGNFATNFAVS